jgi:hypothetical protein
MAEYPRRGHTVTDLQYHFVWATKYRLPVFEREVAVPLPLCRTRGDQAAKRTGQPFHHHAAQGSGATFGAQTPGSTVPKRAPAT